MARVTVEDCVRLVPNRFDLVLMAAQRAREISSGAAPSSSALWSAGVESTVKWRETMGGGPGFTLAIIVGGAERACGALRSGSS